MADGIDTPEIQDLVKKFITVRDKKKELNEAHDAKIVKYDAALEAIQNQLNILMTEQGAESVKTLNGTCYFSARYKVSSGDWLATEQYAIDNNRLDIFERRLSSKVIKEIVEATGALPPGVNAQIEKTVNVRSPKVKGDSNVE